MFGRLMYLDGGGILLSWMNQIGLILNFLERWGTEPI